MEPYLKARNRINKIMKEKECIKIKEYIKENEGSKKNNRGRHILYRCSSGKWTCGYGRNAEDNGFSEAEADIMLEHDIEDSLRGLVDIFGLDEILILDRNRQIVLIDMTFNLGINRFSKFKKLIAAIKDKDYGKAADEIKNSRYYNQVQNRAERNIKLMKGEAL